MVSSIKNLITSTVPASKRFLCWLIGGVAVCNLIVGISLYYGLRQQKADAVDRAALSAQNLVQAISQSMQFSAEKLDDSLQSTVFALERQLREQQRIEPDAIASLLAEQRGFHIGTSPWAISDASGKVIFMEGAVAPPAVNLADRPFFQLLRHGRHSQVRLSDIVSNRHIPEQAILSARSYHKPDGAFAGVVVAPVPLSHFQQFLKDFRLPAGSWLSITTDQNVLIALRSDGSPRQGGVVGQPLPVSEEYRRLQTAGTNAATYHVNGPTDGVPRLYSFQRVAHTPLTINLGQADNDYLQSWYGMLYFRTGIYAVLLLTSLTLCTILILLWRKQARYASDLQNNNVQLRALLGVGEVGLCGLDYLTGEWISSPEQDAIFGINAGYPRTRDAWAGLIHPDDLEFLLTAIRRDFESHTHHYEYEYRIIRPVDGKTRWVQVTGQFEYLPDHTPARMFGAIKDITALRESQQHIDRLAYYDELTGLPNRVLLTERLQQAMLRTRRRGGALVVCSLDLDGFKPVNDAWGHSVGDQLLIEAAGRLTHCLREEDTVARIGGDEFVLLLGGMEQAAQITAALERIRTTLAEPFALPEAEISVTVSIGASAYPSDNAVDADSMLRHADQAMHEAKLAGKNGVRWFDPETDRRLLETRIQYERLVQALENREFVLYFQPKVDLHSDTVEGAEALIRWMHPEEGLLPPSRFLPIIENTDLCVPLGEWVIREALRQNQCWRDAGVALNVCVNLFPHHLQQADFPRRLAQILREFPRLPRGIMNLEVLETSLLKDLADVSRRIRECTALGVDFSLDDFGTGYSSLSYFSRLPVKVVKIDQSFTRGILTSAADLALVQSIVNMSHSIGREVVAEGVETPEHGLPLIACGCDIAQGYGVARPMPGDKVPAWVAAWRRPAAWLQTR